MRRWGGERGVVGGGDISWKVVRCRWYNIYGIM